jgi:general secretion pathway protein D
VPITTQTSENLDNSDARIVNQVSYRDTGVILTITPRINERGRVLLEIEQEVSDVQETRTSGIDSPTISQRRVTTTVLVNDGQAIALGGLIQKSQNRGRTQIPILGDIPLVGTAFRSKDDQVDKTELIILIRPQVMRDLEEVQHVTDEFKLQFKERVLDARDKSRAAEKVFRRAFD